ncbi:prenyltransferase and squalene oxidase repeat domain-containing protein [Trichoderma breve]|uniref:Prenyltransferase and squalene oxidase repeat domain-containing protein n=1 Tax=Trichoderma breve TaxID=2034170 RepID=A0A9W9E288_9HYPO|nr:prenyltransferase and squalene oxidase repeat domain-containing protein [Trichoderma breve]KAJ4855004.1 prenyltransferase and squalene oxidase repeat domain-containing protein [Trichoderma breve]
MSSPDAEEPKLDKARHVKYWQRCHNTFLPSAYTSNDSTRLTFAFFIISALDLLSVPLTAQDRAAARAWVLSLQHPDGGFCGSPTHSITGDNASKGSANIAATFFALIILGLVAESEEEQRSAFAGVDRKALLLWLKKLQRNDGSFGQVLWEGEPTGGRDMRHSYLASIIRFMLRGSVQEGDENWVEDIDTEGMIEYIRSVQTYDGGIAESSTEESHGGYAYCAIAALNLLDRHSETFTPGETKRALDRGIANRQSLLRFFASRHFPYLAKEEETRDETAVNHLQAKLGELSLDGRLPYVGFNGRWNKKADTCYTWWACGALRLLDCDSFYDAEPSCNYLLDITQHRIGGFGKSVGDPPDIYHSYLGLTTVALLGGSELKEADAGFCCSKEGARKIEVARDGLLETLKRQSEQRGGWGADEFWGKAAEVIKVK